MSVFLNVLMLFIALTSLRVIYKVFIHSISTAGDSRTEFYLWIETRATKQGWIHTAFTTIPTFDITLEMGTQLFIVWLPLIKRQWPPFRTVHPTFFESPSRAVYGPTSATETIHWQSTLFFQMWCNWLCFVFFYYSIRSKVLARVSLSFVHLLAMVNWTGIMWVNHRGYNNIRDSETLRVVLGVLTTTL